MGKIVLLDELTINQIAAGEVIERPASVVKEMLENSIDAGAKNITIEIKNGGISLIRITDDGSGISEDDMEIAFERHATSKIRSATDLQTVTTMGFRGEALASISAIANVEMISKTGSDLNGHKIVVEGGKVLEKSEVGATTGTRITVKNLFYNTPVRYKFLKKDYTEAGYIEDVVTRIALINKGIAIKLINNDKVLLQTTGSLDTKNIIYSIYGKDVANGIKDVEYVYEDIKVTGVVGLPEIARSNRANQLFFVNGRFVRDKNLTAGIEQAYKDLIPNGKYAFSILNLDINPNEVDVNVHPAKLEVRFQDEQKVFKAVYYAVKYALDGISPSKERIFDVEEPIKGFNTNINAEEKNEEGQAKFEVNFVSSINGTEKSEEKKEQELETFEGNEKKGISELLKKFKKDKDEKEDEKDNTLLEIFNARKLEKDISKPLEEKIMVANEDIADKEVKLGDTLVSSNTRELDFDVKEALKDKTLVMDSVNKIEKQETMVIPTTKQTASAEEASVPPLDAVEKMTSKILEMKMSSLDNTQMIDTSKVREAMIESQKITPEFANMYKKTFGLEANEIRKERKIEEQEREKIRVSNEFVGAENHSLFEKEPEVQTNVKYRFVGIAFKNYIIIEYKNEMYIIDEMSARERINFERVKNNYYSSEKDSTSLLLPDIVTCSSKEMSLAKENIELFRNAGFDFEEFGENTIKLTSVPSMCEELNTKALFLNILSEIENVAVNDIEEKEKKFIRAVAVNSTISPKLKIDEKEVDNLLQELLSLEEPFTAPQGKSTAIKMSRSDIEKKFARRK